MAGISNISAGLSLGNYLQTKSSTASRPELTEEQRAQFAAKREQHLDEALAAAGIDEETADAIKADLKATFEDSFSGSEGQPDRAAIKEQIDGIFAKYGLEASEILGKPDGIGHRPAGAGPPPGGPSPSSEDSESPSTDSVQYENLLEIIEDLAGRESDPKVLAQLVVDALYGLDQTA